MSETIEMVLLAGGGVAAGAAALLAVLALRGRIARHRTPARGPGADALQERIDALKALLPEADRRIRRLRELSGAEGQTGAAGASDRTDEIRRLADAGAAPERIAERLGVDVGEVELLLNLQRAGSER